MKQKKLTHVTVWMNLDDTIPSVKQASHKTMDTI